MVEELKPNERTPLVPSETPVEPEPATVETWRGRWVRHLANVGWMITHPRIVLGELGGGVASLARWTFRGLPMPVQDVLRTIQEVAGSALGRLQDYTKKYVIHRSSEGYPLKTQELHPKKEQIEGTGGAPKREVMAATTPSPRAKGVAGFRLVTIPGDGSCLFRSVTEAVRAMGKGDLLKGRSLREQIVAHVRKNLGRYEGVLGNEIANVIWEEKDEQYSGTEFRNKLYAYRLNDEDVRELNLAALLQHEPKDPEKKKIKDDWLEVYLAAMEHEGTYGGAFELMVISEFTGLPIKRFNSEKPTQPTIHVGYGQDEAAAEENYDPKQTIHLFYKPHHYDCLIPLER